MVVLEAGELNQAHLMSCSASMIVLKAQASLWIISCNSSLAGCLFVLDSNSEYMQGGVYKNPAIKQRKTMKPRSERRLLQHRSLNLINKVNEHNRQQVMVCRYLSWNTKRINCWWNCFLMGTEALNLRWMSLQKLHLSGLAVSKMKTEPKLLRSNNKSLVKVFYNAHSFS